LPNVGVGTDGYGWVNWSGLATLLADLDEAINSSLNALLPRILAAR
jgi:hypothetical protein